MPSLARGAFFLVLLLTAPASARRNGIVTQGCQACHGDSAQSTLSITADPPSFGPGELVTFTAMIQRSGVAVGGIYVATPELGTLRTISGEGLSLVTGGLTHNAPKPAQSGRVSFRFQWQAPASAGAIQLAAYGLAANGDGQSTGDAPGSSVFSFPFGCSAQTYYFDADGDGYGGTQFPAIQACAGKPPKTYSANADDCDDGRDSVHPGATELCNKRDDNCDGRADEDAQPEPLWPDPDGDGYYASGAGPSQIGCLPLAGYAREPGDCAASDAARHPGASETCNQLDDNCDGRIDEGLRPQCGLGWCRRESLTCRSEDCVPGVPTLEMCNGIDDDCDGSIDEGVCGSTGGATSLGGSTSQGGASRGGASSLGGSLSGGTSSAGRAPFAGSPSSGGAATTGGWQNGSATASGGTAQTNDDIATSGCSLAARPTNARLNYLAALLLALTLRRARRRCAPNPHCESSRRSCRERVSSLS